MIKSLLLATAVASASSLTSTHRNINAHLARSLAAAEPVCDANVKGNCCGFKAKVAELFKRDGLVAQAQTVFMEPHMGSGAYPLAEVARNATRMIPTMCGSAAYSEVISLAKTMQANSGPGCAAVRRFMFVGSGLCTTNSKGDFCGSVLRDFESQISQASEGLLSMGSAADSTKMTALVRVCESECVVKVGREWSDLVRVIRNVRSKAFATLSTSANLAATSDAMMTTTSDATIDMAASAISAIPSICVRDPSTQTLCVVQMHTQMMDAIKNFGSLAGSTGSALPTDSAGMGSAMAALGLGFSASMTAPFLSQMQTMLGSLMPATAQTQLNQFQLASKSFNGIACGYCGRSMGNTMEIVAKNQMEGFTASLTGLTNLLQPGAIDLSTLNNMALNTDQLNKIIQQTLTTLGKTGGFPGFPGLPDMVVPQVTIMPLPSIGPMYPNGEIPEDLLNILQGSGKDITSELENAMRDISSSIGLGSMLKDMLSSTTTDLICTTAPTGETCAARLASSAMGSVSAASGLSAILGGGMFPTGASLPIDPTQIIQTMMGSTSGMFNSLMGGSASSSTGGMADIFNGMMNGGVPNSGMMAGASSLMFGNFNNAMGGMTSMMMGLMNGVQQQVTTSNTGSNTLPGGIPNINNMMGSFSTMFGGMNNFMAGMTSMTGGGMIPSFGSGGSVGTNFFPAVTTTGGMFPNIMDPNTFNYMNNLLTGAFGSVPIPGLMTTSAPPARTPIPAPANPDNGNTLGGFFNMFGNMFGGGSSGSSSTGGIPAPSSPAVNSAEKIRNALKQSMGALGPISVCLPYIKVLQNPDTVSAPDCPSDCAAAVSSFVAPVGACAVPMVENLLPQGFGINIDDMVKQYLSGTVTTVNSYGNVTQDGVRRALSKCGLRETLNAVGATSRTSGRLSFRIPGLRFDFFNQFASRLAALKESLQNDLADRAGVNPSDIIIENVRTGSVIADVTVQSSSEVKTMAAVDTLYSSSTNGDIAFADLQKTLSKLGAPQDYATNPNGFSLSLDTDYAQSSGLVKAASLVSALTVTSGASTATTSVVAAAAAAVAVAVMAMGRREE